METGCDVVSTGNPTYLPTDSTKTPYLIDFFIINKISKLCIKLENEFDLNSDHSPIYMTANEKAINRTKFPFLTNKFTDWQYFQTVLQNSYIPPNEPETITKLRKALSFPQNLFKALHGKAHRTLLIDDMLFHTLLI